MSKTKSTEAAVIGVDLAKSIFHIHGASADGSVIYRKKLSRSKMHAFFSSQSPCIVVMEACGSAHHWARQLASLGHTKKMIHPPSM